MKLLRVFPRRTQATPDDALVHIGPPGLFPPECDQVHVSVTFTYDLPEAERIAEAWSHIVPTELGGPGLGDPGGEFIPGRYLKKGYVITSRGCPNKCWFCFVPKREGSLRELPITDGWRVQDNNLLACSPAHIKGVFAMLARQPERAVFQGGLESSRMAPWIAEGLARIHPLTIYFAYDSPNDKEPLAAAITTMKATGHNWGHSISAYVLVGYPHDTFAAAEERMKFVLSLGVLPFAMLYRDQAGRTDAAWRKFQKSWCRPVIVGAKLRQYREHQITAGGPAA